MMTERAPMRLLDERRRGKGETARTDLSPSARVLAESDGHSEGGGEPPGPVQPQRGEPVRL